MNVHFNVSSLCIVFICNAWNVKHFFDWINPSIDQALVREFFKMYLPILWVFCGDYVRYPRYDGHLIAPSARVFSTQQVVCTSPGGSSSLVGALLHARTHRLRGWSRHFPCASAGGDCAPHTQARAAILKVTPHSGSDRAAVRNHDWRWRILSSWRDMPDSEMGKRSLVWQNLPARTTFNDVFLNFVFFSPQWKTRWLVLRKPSPVAGNLFHTLDLFKWRLMCLVANMFCTCLLRHADWTRPVWFCAREIEVILRAPRCEKWFAKQTRNWNAQPRLTFVFHTFTPSAPILTPSLFSSFSWFYLNSKPREDTSFLALGSSHPRD